MLIQSTCEVVQKALSRQASVVLIGPRQVGKTTLALQIGARQNALYLDLEAPQTATSSVTWPPFCQLMKTGLSSSTKSTVYLK